MKTSMMLLITAMFLSGCGEKKSETPVYVEKKVPSQEKTSQYWENHWKKINDSANTIVKKISLDSMRNFVNFQMNNPFHDEDHLKLALFSKYLDTLIVTKKYTRSEMKGLIKKINDAPFGLYFISEYIQKSLEKLTRHISLTDEELIELILNCNSFEENFWKIFLERKSATIWQLERITLKSHNRYVVEEAVIDILQKKPSVEILERILLQEKFLFYNFSDESKNKLLNAYLKKHPSKKSLVKLITLECDDVLEDVFAWKIYKAFQASKPTVSEYNQLRKECKIPPIVEDCKYTLVVLGIQNIPGYKE
jgi:hypothetical protein